MPQVRYGPFPGKQDGAGPEIYSKVKAVVDEIYPKLELLDGGSQYSGSGFKALSYANGGAKDERLIDQAARDVYAWLGKEADPFPCLSANP